MKTYLIAPTKIGSLCSIVIAAIAVLLMGGVSQRAAAQSSDHVVLAYYYAWWEPARISSALFTPSQAFPSGLRQIRDDPELMRQHIRQAQAAGIDGFIVNRASDLAVLLPLAREAGFSVTLHLDGGESELRAFYQYANDPAIVRYQGHPVLFFWQASLAGPSFWHDLRGAIDPDHNVLWIADGDKFNILADDAWDGISPYAIAWSPNPRGQLPSWAAKARASGPGKLYIPPVSPGCDDSLVRTPTCVRDRADGSYYEAAWEGALASSPSWAIVVSTWNEWMEATQIEPAAQYGDAYLQITRQYSDVFKNS